MGELLTTGEMIDRLKVGEIAETEEGYRVTRNRNMSITFLNKEPKYGQYLAMDLTAHRLEWRIQPNYVSFEEAMQALRDGKDITFHGNKGTSELTYSVIEEPLKELVLGRYSLGELFEGKWTIEED